MAFILRRLAPPDLLEYWRVGSKQSESHSCTEVVFSVDRGRRTSSIPTIFIIKHEDASLS